MPIRKVRGGWKVGTGRTVYRTRAKAAAAQRAIHAKQTRRRR